MDTKTDRAHSTKAADATATADDLGAGNIDKVRDILFGGQMRDYERRFARLEERLLQETTEMKEDVRKRLSALEQFLKQEVESLADRIRAEHDERTDADRTWRARRAMRRRRSRRKRGSWTIKSAARSGNCVSSCSNSISA